MSNSYLALLKSIDLPSKSSRQKPVSSYGGKVNSTSSFGSVPDATVLQSPLNVADRLSPTDATVSDPASIDATQSEVDCDPTTTDALTSATGSDPAAIDATKSETDCDPAAIDATKSETDCDPTATDALPSATGSDHAAIDVPPSNSYLALLKSIGVRSKSSRQKSVSSYGVNVNSTSSFGSVPDAIVLKSPLNVAARLSPTDATVSDPASIDATQSEADCDPTTTDALTSATGSDHAAIDVLPSNSYLALLKSIGVRSKSRRQKPVSYYGRKVNPASSFGSVPNATALGSPLNAAGGHSATKVSATGGNPATSHAPPQSNSYLTLLKSFGLRSKSSRQKPVSCYGSKVNPASSYGSVSDATDLLSSLNVADRHSATGASAIGGDPAAIDAPSPPSNSYPALLKSSSLRSKSSRRKPVSCFGSKVNPASSFGSVNDATDLRSSLNVANRHSATDVSAIGGDPAAIDALPPVADGLATGTEPASLDALPPPATYGSATGGNPAAIDTPPSNSYLTLLKSFGLRSKSSRQRPVSCYGSKVNPTSSFGSVPDATALRSSFNVADRHSDTDSSESDYDPSSTDALPLAAGADFAVTDAPSATDVVLADTEAQPPLSTGTEEWNLVQYQLLLILHANKCPSNENQTNEEIGQCPFLMLTNKTLYSHCSTMRQVLRHMSTCRGRKFCSDVRCYSSAQIISHWINCTHKKCLVCLPLKQKIRRIQRKMSKRVRKEEKRLKRDRSKDSRDCNRNLRLKKSN